MFISSDYKGLYNMRLWNNDERINLLLSLLEEIDDALPKIKKELAKIKNKMKKIKKD